MEFNQETQIPNPNSITINELIQELKKNSNKLHTLKLDNEKLAISLNKIEHRNRILYKKLKRSTRATFIPY